MAKAKPTPHVSPPAEPTPAERLHTLRAIVEHRIEASRKIVDVVAKDLADPAKSPLEVLAWSSRMFDAAATLEVAKEIAARLAAEETIVDVHAHVLRAALRGARNGSTSSSSQAANLAASSRTTAYADFEELLRHDATKLRDAKA